MGAYTLPRLVLEGCITCKRTARRPETNPQISFGINYLPQRPLVPRNVQQHILKEQNAPHSSLLTEELLTLLDEAVKSFSIVAASNQETGSLLIQQEQPEDYRRFKEIQLFLVVKAWSWLGYALSLQDASSSFVDAIYGVARKNYNDLCCISGNDRRVSIESYAPTTVPNLASAHAAPLA
jgi:hypothetical protein